MTEQGERPPSVAVLGGTFDPIHHGHLRLALELRDRLGFDQVRLLPCALPVHRESPGCSALQRLEMVELAVGHEPGLIVDDREVRSDRPSYSIDSLQSLRAELGERTCLTLVMGTDAFLQLDSWHRWQELLQLCHILVVVRPGWHLPELHPMRTWLEQNSIEQVEQLTQRPAGFVLLQQLSSLEISASAIRQQIRDGQSPRFLLPDVVWSHIRQQGLYLSPRVIMQTKTEQVKTMQTEQLIELVQTTLEGIKARDIVLLDVRGKSSVTDYMIIASGSSNRHVKSAADSVSVAVKKAGITPLGIEGMETGEWALVDLVDVVVHVMQAHVRDLYDLEGLWGPDAEPSAEAGKKTGEPTRD